MKSTYIRKYLAVISIVGALMSLAVPARASGLTLAERIAQADVTAVTDTAENRSLADGVVTRLSGTADPQSTVDNLTDAEVAAFAAYYLPFGSAAVQSGLETITTKPSRLKTALLSMTTCYGSNITTTAKNVFGQGVISVTVYGTWCSDGTSVVSAPSVSSTYSLGGAFGWQFKLKHPDMSTYSSSQAKFLAAYDMAYVFAYPVYEITVCAKMYGNASGGYSSSTSCVL